MTLSRHDKDLANAMVLKLRLKHEARQTEKRLREVHGEFRYGIAARCVSGHQRTGAAGAGLTVEYVLEIMGRDGF